MQIPLSYFVNLLYIIQKEKARLFYSSKRVVLETKRTVGDAGPYKVYVLHCRGRRSVAARGE